MGSTSRAHSLVALGALAAIGMAGLLYATYQGPGLTSDSLTYLAAARNLLKGRGFTLSPTGTRPLTDFPPLFPSVLAALGLLGLDLRGSTRWLNVVLFGGTIVLAGIAIRHVTSGSAWASLFGGLLVATSADLLEAYSLVMSDPLFIALGLLGLVALGAYIDHPEYRRLIGAAIIVALAFLARYPGAALVATGVFGLLLLGKAKWRRRAVDAAVFAGLSSIGMVFWVIRNWRLAGQPIGESRTVFAVHFPTLSQLDLALDTVWRWLAPGRALAHGPAALVGHLPGIRWLVLAAATMVGAFALLRWRSRAKRPVEEDNTTSATPSMPPSLWLPPIFALLYTALVVLDVTFVDASERLGGRLLSPVFVAALVFGIGVWCGTLRSWRGSLWASRATIIAAALLGGAYTETALVWIRHAHEEGLAYSARVWRESDTLRRLSAIPADVLIYSSTPDIITIVTGRSAQGLPGKVHRPSRKANLNYQAELDAMREQLRNHAVVVYLRRATWRQPFYASEEELKHQFHMRLRAAAADGSIYDIAP